MRCRVLALLFSISLGCPESPAPPDQSLVDAAAPTDAAGADAAAPDGAADLGGGDACQNVRECAFLPLPTAVRGCQRPAWSCIAGRCTVECGASRTCYADAQGCLNCDGKPGGCPGAQCVGPPLATARIEDATCQRGFLGEVQSCFGAFARLKDGTICSVLDLPTGLIREILACGPCQTQLVF